MSTYFFVIFEMHYMVSKYDVFIEKYMDLSLRLIPKGSIMIFMKTAKNQPSLKAS